MNMTGSFVFHPSDSLPMMGKESDGWKAKLPVPSSDGVSTQSDGWKTERTGTIDGVRPIARFRPFERLRGGRRRNGLLNSVVAENVGERRVFGLFWKQFHWSQWTRTCSRACFSVSRALASGDPVSLVSMDEDVLSQWRC